MARYNRFGAVYGDVLNLYPGTVLADYDAGGAAGQTKLEAAIDRACSQFALAVSPRVWEQFTRVDAEQTVIYAADGQTTFTLGLGPIDTTTLHVWRYPSLAARVALNIPGYGDRPVRGLWEELNFSTSQPAAVCTVTLTQRPCNIGERVFASYDVKTDDAAFAMLSIAQSIVYGAATEVGAWLYTDGQQEWKTVGEYRERWTAALAAAKDGSWVPDELRKLRYWTPVERASTEVKSVDRLRG